MNTAKIVITVILIALGAWFVFFAKEKSTTSMATIYKTYTNDSLGFSVVHSREMSVDDSYRYTGMGPSSDIRGVSFSVPSVFARRTNLSPDTKLSVEKITGKDSCSVKDFLLTIKKEETIAQGSVMYHVVYGERKEAGNVYEEIVYLLPECRAIRYFIHTTTTGNDDVRTAPNFDRTRLLAMFDQIRNSYVALETKKPVIVKPTSDARIRVTAPLPGALVASPLVVKGEARGNWYFEASFPVRLRDANGKELVAKPAQAQGEWMTTEFVPFEVTLNFAKPTTKTGTLILERDNPSGLPEHAAQVEIPVTFK